ncbi:MAG: host attachment protein [Gammaproteobacteria bacterium]|nr:host attachment protein [Gammaproteobacteria bacterium]
MIWVINTNSNVCHFYEYHKKPSQLKLLKKIVHPENKLKTSEYLTSDRPGHYQTDGSVHGAYSPHTDPKEVSIDSFSREIAKELNHGRTSNSYNNLIIITTPHMDGLIHQHLDKHVNDLVTHNIHKDLMHLTDAQLLDFLDVNTKFPG